MTSPMIRRFRGRSRSFWFSAVIATGIVAAVGFAVAEVVLFYQASTSVGGTTSPFRFVNGGGYANAHVEGFQTNTYPNAAQTSVGLTTNGANGAVSTYVLDALEVTAQVASTTNWNLRVDVTTALVGTGINAAYLFTCTVLPTTVPGTGIPLASGVDVNGNPWAIFAPTCTGTATSISLTTPGSGSSVAFPTLTVGQVLLYVSFGVAVTNTGATTTTAAVATLVASSP